MDLSSRWDRAFLSLSLFLFLITMSGCAALSNGSTISNGAVTVAASNINFGTVVVGSSKQVTDTVTNRSRFPVTIVSATASNSSFSVSSPSLPITIAPGQSTTLTIAFTPQATGNPAGRIVVMSGDQRSARAYISVSGNAIGAGKVDLNPTALSFGSVAVGQSIAKRVTITNSGSTSVVLSQDSTSSSAYTVSGLTLPATIAPGQTATLTVTFAPKSMGSIDGNVTLNGNASLVVSGASGSSNPSSQAINAILQVSGSGIGAAQLAASPASVAFGNVTIGTPQSTTITLTNSGTDSETISQASASGAGFTISGLALPMNLAAGQSTTFTATYAPAAAGTLTGSIVISSTGTNASLTIPASGTAVTPGALSATPTSIAFGNIAVGTTQSQSETLRNTGGSLLHITAATITGTGFGDSGITVPTTLNPGQSLTFNVSFSPNSGGAASGSLALTADGSVPSLTVALSGSGTAPGQLTLTPGSTNFGNVTVGVTQTQSATLTASGGSVTVSATSSTNPEFGISGLSLPLNLAAGQSVPFTLTFTPQASGAASGAITLTTNASNAPLSESLSGTGVAAPQHSVTLAWNASTSTVVGYNVYRGTQSGGPYSVISSGPDSSTSYTDNVVQAGQTYYYVVTAVDGSGNESVNSNQAQAVIPTP
jgi:HYDIN/CFA65/VesB family protein/centrosomal CEP192-like protein/ASPM-SPD-2-Hydin domain-containing protein